MSKKIIGFSGHKGCGKTTAADTLQEYGFVRMSFAWPLKLMIWQFMVSLEFTAESIKRFMDEDKELELSGINKSTRYLMQTLGTEWGRNLVHPDVWVMMIRDSLDKSFDQYIVFDDVRFENEATLIRGMGGLIIHINRAIEGGFADDHASEAGLWCLPCDAYINNDASLSKLKENVIETVFSFLGQ